MAQSEANSNMGGGGSDYPVQLSVDYQGARNRLSVLLRIILAIPILVVFGFIVGYVNTGNRELNEALLPLSAGGFLFIGPLLMIVFRKKYPRWWFDWNLELSRFTLRVSAFLLLLRDEYPSTDEEQSAHLQIEYPNVETDLNRILPIFKWLLAIPHYIILAVLWILVIPATIRAWLLILVTGGYPQGIFDFVVGVLRWTNRVGAYAFLLTTDRYPPFRLSA